MRATVGNSSMAANWLEWLSWWCWIMSWSLKKGSDFFDYEEKKGRDVVAEASGWQASRRQYAFVYVANVAGEISLLPDKTAVDLKFPFS